MSKELSKGLRILITGFGPFPGAPFNPTIPLVERLTSLRRPALDSTELAGHIFHVTYQTVDRELPELIARAMPNCSAHTRQACCAPHAPQASTPAFRAMPAPISATI